MPARERCRPNRELPSWSPGSLGRIEVRSVDPSQRERPGVQIHKYVWVPHQEMRSEFAANFELSLFCHTTDSGFRFFVPCDCAETFLLRASSGGMAYLTRDWNCPVRDSMEPSAPIRDYRFQQLILQWSWNAKRSMKSEIHRVRALSLRPDERVDQSIFTILPLSLFRTSQVELYEAQSEILALFLDGGKSNVEERVGRRLSDTEFIRLRILELARTDPLQIRGNSMRIHERRIGMVRNALQSELDAEGKPAAEVVEEVRRRLWEAYQKHDHLNTDQFSQWFFKDLDNIYKSIAKRNCGNLNLDNREVRRSLGVLIYESQLATSLLVRLQMKGFKAELTPPLIHSEEVAFDALFDAHDWSGDLIPMMFYAHADLLRPLFCELQSENCSKMARAAFINAIVLKTEMLKNRRQADRQRKSRRVVSPDMDELPARDQADQGRGECSPEELEEHRTERQREFDELVGTVPIETVVERFTVELSGCKTNAQIASSFANLCEIGGTGAVPILIACTSDLTIKTSARIASVRQLLHFEFTGEIGSALQHAFRRGGALPRERIAAIDALANFHERNIRSRPLAEHIAGMILALETVSETPRRVRQALLKAIERIRNRQLERPIPRRRATRGF